MGLGHQSVMFSLGSSNCILAFVLVLCGTLIGQKESSDGQLQTKSHHCPTWTYFNNCQCGTPVHNIISCVTDGNISEVDVLFRFCMTQNKEHTKVVVGPYPYNNDVKSYHDTTYVPLPSNISELDTAMCGGTGRSGQLCGKCVEGYSPPVYSYYLECVKCTAGTNNWTKYLAVSLLPTTAFFIGALVFWFRATSPFLNGYILLWQTVTSPPMQRLIMYSGLSNNLRGISLLSYIYYIWVP